MGYDLLGVDQRKRTVLVEVQRAGQTGFKDRTLFYASQLLRRQGADLLWQKIYRNTV